MARRPAVYLDRAFKSRSVMRLGSTAAGAYAFLVLAVLTQDMDIEELNQAQIQWVTHTTPLQWKKIKKDVIKAFDATMPMLKKLYQKELDEFERFSKVGFATGTKNLMKWNEKIRQLKFNKVVVHSDTKTDVGIIQPLKHSTYRGDNHADMQQRTAIIASSLAKKSTGKANTATFRD